MKARILNCILYGGISKAEYKKVEEDIFQANLKNVLVFGWLASLIYIILFFQVSFSKVLSVMQTIYKISAIYYLVLAFAATLCFKLKRNFRAAPYIGTFGALTLGAIIGIFVNSDTQTTTFMVFLFAIPLLFTLRPVFASLVIVLADLLYIYLVLTRQSGVLLARNLSNAIIYGIVSMLFSGYMMNLKIRAFANAKNYKFLMEKDQLTGLNNRLSFDTFLEKLNKCKRNYTILEFDINGLKVINDTKGHKAGDELILAAAQCIVETFGKYGQCFRIGGDEFVAILDKPIPNEAELCAEFEKRCAGWKSENIDKVSVAYGITTVDCRHETIDEILVRVDSLMYNNKRTYYSQAGHDRRKRAVEA